MKYLILPGFFLTLSVAAMIFTGCTSDTAPSAENAGVQNTSSKLRGFLPGLAGGDSAVGNGVFSVSWRMPRRPHDSIAAMVGSVMAMCFPDSFKPGISPHPKPIDAGTVTLACNGTTITLLKSITPRGVMYVLPRTPGGASPSVNFVPGASYAFSASGSGAFAPFQGSINAPHALIAITGPAKNGAVDSTSDLAITWTGGAPGGSVMIVLNALPSRRGRDWAGSDSSHSSLHNGKGRRGLRTAGVRGERLSLADRGPGADNHWGAMHGGRGMRGRGAYGNSSGSGRRSVTVRLTSNPGSYTIPIATLKTLEHFGSGAHLAISVSEFYRTAIAHDSGSVSVGFRTGDRVGIAVK